MAMSEASKTAFDTWPEWQLPLGEPPTIIRRLSGGLTNELYLLKGAGLRLVMRVNTNQVLAGIDRFREQKILENIQGRPFAPVVFYCNPARQILVTQYIEGYHWRAGDMSEPEKLERLVSLIQHIQEHGKGIPLFDYQGCLQDYWQQLLESNKPFPMAAHRLYKGIEERLPAFQQNMEEGAGVAVLCHHDLTPTNVIETDAGQLIVLDWEYAGAGSALIEALWLTRFWEAPELMARLTGREVNEESLALARDVVAFYDLAWSLLRS